MKQVIFFPNGVAAVFDEQGEQMPELQRSWLKLFVVFLEDHDEDPMEFEYTMPNGSHAKLIKKEDGDFTWSFQ